MGKLNQNFVMFKGDVLDIDFLHVGPFWTSHKQVISINPTDTAEWRLHAVDDPSTVYVKRTSANGDIIFTDSGYYGVSDDLIKVKLIASNTATRDVGSYEHQLLITYGGESPVVVASGTVTLKARSEGNPT